MRLLPADPERAFESMARRPELDADIPWSELSTRDIPEKALASVRSTFEGFVRSEWLAVPGFEMLARSVAAGPSSPAMLAAISRFSSEERRHAELYEQALERIGGLDRALAEEMRATVAALDAQFRAQKSRAARGKPDDPLPMIGSMLCASETISLTVISEIVKRTAHPTLNAMLRSILRDEVHHAGFGWAYLAFRWPKLKARDKKAIGAPFVAAVKSACAYLAGDAGAGADEEDGASDFACFSYGEQARIGRRVFDEGISPALESLGLPL